MIGNDAGSGHEEGSVGKIIFAEEKARQFIITALELGEGGCAPEHFLVLPRNAQHDLVLGTGETADEETGSEGCRAGFFGGQ